MSAREIGVRSARACLLLTLAVGCAAESAEAPAGQDEKNVVDDGVPVQAISADLRLGDEGPSVSALHSYLTRFGYFPNEALARRYARWQPLVAEAPAYQDVFDEHTQAAVEALQRQFGLEATGYVDAATRAMLHAARCGTPDGIPSVDNEPSDEKFFFLGSKVDNSVAIKFDLRNVGGGLELNAAIAATRSGFNAWSAETQLSFIDGSGRTQQIEITFAPVADNQINAFATSPADGSDITFNSNRSFTTTLPTPAGSLDFQTILMHELGHALGLGHSSTFGTTMFATTADGTSDRTLHKDDKAAISALYDTWALKPGRARDIAAGDAGVVWAIGDVSKANNNFSIHQWNGSDWNLVDGAATRIAVRSTEAWVVNAQNQIFRRRNGGWLPVAGCATDIAASLGTDDVWVIACGGVPHKWNEATSSWVASPGIAPGTRIAVTATGIPWVVQANGNVFEHSSSSATSGSWDQRAGCARDIGAFHNVWITNCTAATGGTKIQIWQTNGAVGGLTPQPAVNAFFTVPGAATNITVGPFGPWVTNSNFAVFQQDKPGTQN
jgi:peptidoglycan hydrolase-like protein with peptidoglycan-binding domain